jgi:putative iron-only hydrogenase system regulator
MKRLGVVGIILKNRKLNAPKVNKILTEYGDLIIGRIGLPIEKKGSVSVITVIIDATIDELGTLTGKLGKVKGVTICSALNK